MSKNVEILSTSGLAKVILVPTKQGALAWYYRLLPSGENWVMDRVCEMKVDFKKAVELATKIVDAPPQPKKRR